MNNKYLQFLKLILHKIATKYLQSCLYEILKPENSADLSDSKTMVTLSPEEVVERLKKINAKYGQKDTCAYIYYFAPMTLSS